MIKRIKKSQKVIMLCTALKGGMRTVVEGYRRDLFFEKWNVELIFTHDFGSALKRLTICLKAFLRILLLILNNKISLLHIHVAMWGSFWRKSIFAILGRLFGIPVILHLHGSEFKIFFNSLPLLGKKFVLYQFELAKAVIVLSESWRNFLLKCGSKANILVLPNYVEVPMLTINHKAKSTINVLLLGKVGIRKGIYDLLPAFAQAVKVVPKLYLRIGGNGEVKEAMKISHDLGLDSHVKFLGWVNGYAKIELLREADIYVLPSYDEGLPVSVLEAMSWGIPVITTSIGGIPELIKDQDNGFLIAPGDRSSLQKLLERLGENYLLRIGIGLSGRETVLKKYSKEKVLPMLDSIYVKCI